MPKLSVIMPVYNAEKYISEAIDSIINQTFADFEFIIIDDCSSDQTVKAIKNYNDKRIRFYQNEHNLGVSATLNRGLDLATGEYIARMDADDISLSERFEKQVDVLDKNDLIGICGANAIVFSDAREYLTELPLCDKDIRYNLFISSPFIHPAVMVRKSLLETQQLRYESEYDGREDYRLWMQISLTKSEMHNIKEPLLKYRVHEGQVTKKKDSTQAIKHKTLKTWYVEKFKVQYCGAEMDALCKISLGIQLKDKFQIAALSSMLNKITSSFNEEVLPRLYQAIINREARNMGIETIDYIKLIKGMPLKAKISGIYHTMRK